MPLYEVFIVINGHDETVLDGWRQTRIVAHQLAILNMNFVAAHSKKGTAKKVPPIEKFMPLPGDEEIIKEKQARRKRQKDEYLAAKQNYKNLGAI